MADPRALLDAYAEEVVDIESDFGVFEPIKRADAAEAMLTALRDVLDICRNPNNLRDDPAASVVYEIEDAITTALSAEAEAEQAPPPLPEPSRCYWSGGVQVHVKPWCRCGRWPWIPIAWGDESH